MCLFLRYLFGTESGLSGNWIIFYSFIHPVLSAHKVYYIPTTGLIDSIYCEKQSETLMNDL